LTVGDVLSPRRHKCQATIRTLLRTTDTQLPAVFAVPLEENTMSATALLIFLLVGAIAGWLAGLIVRGFGFGLIGNIVVGIIGAFLAGWLLPRLGISFVVYSPLVTSIVYALIGAVILLALIGVIKRA
jgi:uncharacterized membrane protein YeaQ/YmgE (transglycosylase-associated protein family)